MIETVNSISATWAQYAWVMTLHTIAFIAFLLFILYLLRRRNARLLRAIALIGVAKCFIPPFVSIETPDLAARSGGALSAVVPGFTINTVVTTTEPTLTITSALMLLWFCLVLMLGGIVARRTARVRRLIAAATPINDLPAGMRQLTSRFRVVCSTEAHSPFVYGFRRFTVVVPRNWHTLSVEQQRAVLLHETAHIAHGDHWLLLVQTAAQILHFFNPLVWLLNNQVHRYSEMACDDAVLRDTPIRAREYSDLLVRIAAETGFTKNLLASTPTFARTYAILKQRILYQFSNKKDGTIKKTLIAVLACAVLPFSWYCTDQARSTEQEETAAAVSDPYTRMPQPDVMPKPVGGIQAIAASLKYPESAYDRNIEGSVVIEARVDAEGKVSSSRVKQSVLSNGADDARARSAFETAAAEAVMNTPFSPALHDGKQVEGIVTIPVTFKMPEKDKASDNVIKRQPDDVNKEYKVRKGKPSNAKSGIKDNGVYEKSAPLKKSRLRGNGKEISSEYLNDQKVLPEKEDPKKDIR